MPAAAQDEAVPAADAAAPQYDCSRWPASVYDPATGLCSCPQGMWWNLRGDACLPRQHAAGEFCNTVWPSSSPFFVAGGGYRCVCAPPLLWDEHATACRPPLPSNDTDCQAEWPGTLPVLSPSGTEFECRCPGGLRWDEASRGCVQGAPPVAPSREFYGEVPSPPAAAVPGAPGAFTPPPPTAGPAYVPPSPPGAAAGDPGAAVQPPPPPGGGRPPATANCEALLSEIRGRAQAGQAAQADALGMKAAIAGCDPAAISEASRARP